MRLYLESAKTPLTLRERVPVPAGVAHFAREEPFPPRSWVERGYDVQHWSEFPRGGHFAALEQPNELANDVAAFLSSPA
jgi:pimeloyl-ACP methyl ester carboxylesterase